MKSKVTDRGQITLPKAVRLKLGIRPGTIIQFKVSGNTIIIKKVEPLDPLRKWRGKGKLPPNYTSVDQYLHEARG
jgi:antitoxin PrlF